MSMREVPLSEAWPKRFPELVTCGIVRDENGRATITPLGWFMPVSFQPPMLAISVGLTRYLHHCLEASGEFVLAFPSERQKDDMLYCGSNSGRDVDKFAETGFEPLPAGVVGAPLLTGACANFECKVVGTLLTGDHTIFAGEIVASHIDDEAGRGLYTLGGEQFGPVEGVPV